MTPDQTLILRYFWPFQGLSPFRGHFWAFFGTFWALFKGFWYFFGGFLALFWSFLVIFGLYLWGSQRGFSQILSKKVNFQPFFNGKTIENGKKWTENYVFPAFIPQRDHKIKHSIHSLGCLHRELCADVWPEDCNSIGYILLFYLFY